MGTRSSTVAVIADRTAYDVRYKPLDEIAVVRMSIYLLTASNLSLLLSLLLIWCPVSFLAVRWVLSLKRCSKSLWIR